MPTAVRRTTARRLAAAFAVVLLLFAAALVTVLVSLHEIGDAEEEATRLDHAKHAGHIAAGLAREQYIHQAHTLLEWNRSHLEHYDEVAKEAAAATARLEAAVTDPDSRARAAEIARLVAESDHLFRTEVVPVVGTSDRSRILDLHHRTEGMVDRVVKLNEELNRDLEVRADAARKRAQRVRASALLAVIVFFVLAIAAAAAVGGYLMRSISRPVALLRAAAKRLGAGDLDARVEITRDDELGELAVVFNQMAQDLAHDQAVLLEKSRLASIGQVAAGVAHEINNPLGVMLGYVRLLRQDTTLAARDELPIIEDELRQCQLIVAGLLDLARPARLRRDEVDVDELAREVVARLAEGGGSDGVEVVVTPPSPVPVCADEGKVRQIITNLITNALAAARDGEVAEVTVTTGIEGERAFVEVLDRGPGIPAETWPRLFEPFFTTRSKGHGLGLAIARSLARAHGGDVELSPGPDGVGIRARLWLPLDVRKEEP
ncbi:MAG: HAMP domain-containing histidine kinase [Dehalococcoidia bacterium]|nr:HAMP domain-containing histidine kinase [Myxococcales bacterium]MCB9492213.1 HAMP domain-containing histidine kinase [Dehalococcoidia bacterium]